MAFAAAASVLSDREIYPSFYRPLSSFDLNAKTVSEMMRQFGWQQLLIITQEESVFSEVHVPTNHFCLFLWLSICLPMFRLQ